jgi:O-antigen/teichoic acid export membrane protein
MFAREGILLLSGSEYLESVVPMQVIMPTLLLIGLSNVTGFQILVPTGRERVVLYSEIAGALVDILLNALLIPRYRSTGAAIGTLVAEIVVLLVQGWALRDEIRESVRGIHFFNLSAGIVLGVAACFWVKLLPLGVFLKLAISGVLFFGVYGGFLILRKEEIVCDLIGQILGRIRKKRSGA